MKRFYSLFLVFILSQVFCFSQPSNINLSNTLIFNGEPYLAINPTNPHNLVVAWMAVDASTNYRVSIKTKTSFDGGATWGNPHVQPHFGHTWYSADVSMQFRNNGTLYLSYIDYHEAPDSGGVYITHSTDGGISWTAPTQVWNGMTEDPLKRPLDRPWLAVDNSGTANDGMFYLTTKPAPWILPPNCPYLKTSTDSGQTWSAYRYVDTTNYLVGNVIAAPMPAPAVTADGALCIAYPSYLPSQSLYAKMLLAKSYNRGASFQYYDLLVNPASVSDTNYKLGYHLAANPANANQLAFACVAQPNGDPDIFLITSNNGGITWNSPVRVNDDAVGNGKAQDMVWVSYEANNKLVVTWRDRRNGSGTGFFQSSDTYCAVSTDNGTSFLPNVRLSDMTAAFDSILEKNGNDFLSCALLNDTIYAAWGDVRSGKLNIYFTKTSDSTGSGTGIISVDGNLPEILSVYPNPASNMLFISFNNNHPAGQVAVKIFNEQGQKVLDKQILNMTKQSELDISRLLAGVYIINVESAGQIIYNDKIVIKKKMIVTAD